MTLDIRISSLFSFSFIFWYAENYDFGATTLSITTLSIKTFSVTVNKPRHSIITLNMMAKH